MGNCFPISCARATRSTWGAVFRRERRPRDSTGIDSVSNNAGFLYGRETGGWQIGRYGNGTYSRAFMLFRRFYSRPFDQFGSKKGVRKRIGDLFDKCTCSPNANRITPPEISSRIAKFNGEIVGIDVIYPSSNCKRNVDGRKITALMMICCLSRFCACAIQHSLNWGDVSATFVNDWVRAVGNPGGIIMDRGSPGMLGELRMGLSHAPPWGMIPAPARTPHQTDDWGEE